MQCQDLDLSKSGQVSLLSEDLSEIKFSINRIIISNTNLLRKITGKYQKTPNDHDLGSTRIKLKFYSVTSGCKLKQKSTIVSIKQNTLKPSESYVLALPKDAINLKVSFPTHEEYQIMGKIYAYDQFKPQDSNSDKILIGTFQINLLEWNKENRTQGGLSQQNNPQNINSLKQIELKISSNFQDTEIEHSPNIESLLVSGFRKGQASEKIENSQFVSFNQQLDKLQNFVEFKVQNGEIAQNAFNSFEFENMEKFIPKQRKLKIVNSIIDEKINNISKIPYLTTRSSHFHLLPERQVLKNIKRTKSEALLQPVSPQKLNEETTRLNLQIEKKRPPKQFKQQVYDLLQEVKHFKKKAKIERQLIEQNTSVSRLNNLYFLMDPNRQNHTNFNSIYKDTPARKTVTEYEELIPLSSVINRSRSELNLSVLENEIQLQMTLDAKYRKVLRTEERLESFEKMRSLSNSSLFKIQQSQENI